MLDSIYNCVRELFYWIEVVTSRSEWTNRNTFQIRRLMKKCFPLFPIVTFKDAQWFWNHLVVRSERINSLVLSGIRDVCFVLGGRCTQWLHHNKQSDRVSRIHNIFEAVHFVVGNLCICTEICVKEKNFVEVFHRDNRSRHRQHEL